jgi:predicted AAA+ superfamily ATPase
MNRKQLKSLANWLNAEDRKPLVIRGARQIGKSTS